MWIICRARPPSENTRPIIEPNLPRYVIPCSSLQCDGRTLQQTLQTSLRPGPGGKYYAVSTFSAHYRIRLFLQLSPAASAWFYGISTPSSSPLQLRFQSHVHIAVIWTQNAPEWDSAPSSSVADLCDHHGCRFREGPAMVLSRTSRRVKIGLVVCSSIDYCM